MHRKVSMGTSSNTKALLQALLWRQQGDIGGRLGKLVIYIHNVMRPIQIFASHLILSPWCEDFWNQKSGLFTSNVTFWYWIDILLWQNIRWKVEVQILLFQLMMSNRVRVTFEKFGTLAFILSSDVFCSSWNSPIFWSGNPLFFKLVSSSISPESSSSVSGTK